MPFCTRCGANVAGAFCSQCGTPADGAAGAAPAGAPQSAPAGAPVSRKTSPIVWILAAVLAFFVICAVAVFGVGWLAVNRARQAGVSFERGGDGGFAIHTRGQDGKNASVEFGTTAGKLPSWVPEYPGSEGHGSFAVRARGDGGEGGNFTFTTPDSVSQVMSYYEGQCKEIGMTVRVEESGGSAGSLIATDDSGDHRTLTIKVLGGGGNTTVNVTYARK